VRDGRWNILLEWCGMRDNRLSVTSLCRRSPHSPLLIVLPHYRVTRLIPVTLLLKLLLLLHLPGIAIP
jgi:hypothetical protein